MGDGPKSMEGVGQHIRPTRQSNNSPTPPRQQGNPTKTLAKAKGGQKWLNGQHNVCPNKGKKKVYQNPQQRGLLPDRRPPARGFKQTEKFHQLSVEDNEFQLHGDFPVASRKDHTSLNHLLNFTYAEREQAQHVVTGRKKGGMKGNSYNKEQFLQANCQFVVQDGGHYAINTVDPDVIVDWELIEQVRVRCREMPSCPICLYPPTAAQVTRCGHIYCWSCILHYLSLSENTWRKCPICYESIHKKDLKSVMAVSENKHSLDQQITMTLMKRTKGSVFALPKFKWVEQEYVPPLSSDEVEMQFSKLVIASPQEILTKIMAKDRSELKSLLLEVEEDKSEEEQFVKLAVEEFEKREKRLMEMCNKVQNEMIENKASNVELEPSDQGGVQTSSNDKHLIFSSDNIPNADLVNNMQEKVINSETTSCLTESSNASDSGKDERSRISISSDDSVSSFKPPGDAKFYYYYQAEDGQHIFLHHVNARCLTEEYGSLENCPEFITGRIVEMECYFVTEELRRRFRYLRHLPLTCEFVTCELDLKPPVLSWDTLSFFKDDLRKRRARRQKKAKEEAKHESKCSSELSAFTGIKQPQVINAATPDLSSEQDFPQQIGSSPDVWIASSPPTSGPWSNAVSGVSDEERSLPGPSFAKALSTGKRSGAQPRPKARTHSEGSRKDGEKCSDDDDDDEEDQCNVVPSFQSAFTDALMVADWNLNVKDVHQDDKSGPGMKGKKNKRKGKKKRLLFSTGSAMKL